MTVDTAPVDQAVLGVEDILALIPHRYPMLFVDRVEELVLGESAIGIKNVTLNEWFFVGHFPGKPVMPGVLIIEAMAQTAGVLVMKSVQAKEQLVYFMSIEKARFRRPVVPGDQVKMHIKRKHHRGIVWKFSGLAYVGDLLVAEAVYTATLAPKNEGK